MSEHKIQTTFFDILRLNERKYPRLKWIYAIANGGKRHIKTATALKAEGVKAGIWDVHIPIPKYNRQHGQPVHGAWIEFKLGKNKLTGPQAEFRDHVLKQGYEVAICYDADNALAFVEEYLNITLTK